MVYLVINPYGEVTGAFSTLEDAKLSERIIEQWITGSNSHLVAIFRPVFEKNGKVSYTREQRG